MFKFILMASSFVALGNLMFRKSIDHKGSAHPYLLVQSLITFLASIFLGPVYHHDYTFNSTVALYSSICGLVLWLLMFTTGKALSQGPATLTIALLNASTVVPAVAMFFLFGPFFGYNYNISLAIGSCLVVIGLLRAGWSHVKSHKQINWFVSIALAFSLHVLFLVLLQVRTLCINFPNHHILFNFNGRLNINGQDLASEWFMPFIFLTAGLCQMIWCLLFYKPAITKHEYIYGTLGGIAQGLGSYFLIKATEVAQGLEQNIIFPLYSVVIIFICNIWGSLLYKEKINWMANGCCLLGIVVSQFGYFFK
ncbi:MAG: hypothetical protein ACOVOR_00960 [Rhabdochlamydiaceae bacterium]